MAEQSLDQRRDDFCVIELRKLHQDSRIYRHLRCRSQDNHAELSSLVACRVCELARS
jgi:hypothetical protein